MIKFLLKGILRDRSRSLFPVMTVATGVFLTVFLYCFLEGIFSDMMDLTARYDTGHVGVTTRAWRELADQIPNDLAILNTEDLLDRLNKEESKMLWVPRIRFGGILDIPDAAGETRSQGPIMGIGTDLLGGNREDIKILGLEKALRSGRLPQAENEILIGDEFAKKLGVKPGDTATLMGSTMYGGMAVYNFKVAGIIRFSVSTLNKGTIVCDIRGVRTALDMQEGASEVLGFSRDMVYAEDKMIKLARRFNEKYSKAEDEFSLSMLSISENTRYGDYIAISKYFTGIIIGVFVFAMAIVLWNSGLLNSLRRYGEIGIRLAMGEPKGTLYRRMIAEAVFVGILGSIIGTVLGLAVSYYLQYVGWDMTGLMKNSEVLMQDVFRTRVTLASYYIGFVPGVIASVLGTMFAGIGIYRRQTSQLFKELES